MKELVVISGKGGTGKTSLVAAFARLADGRAVLADCDVDAADLHLVVTAQSLEEHDFSGRDEAVIDPARCSACGRCVVACRFDALKPSDSDEAEPPMVDSTLCEGCGVCALVCPENAVTLAPVVNGRWLVSQTPFGPLVHARLGVAQDNSGKLVTLVRNEARRVATEHHRDLVIADGSPGIGCPVIASMAGANLVLVVTEPSVSGVHDVERVLQLATHFRRPVAVCINKWDLSESQTRHIEELATQSGALFTSRVPYDRGFTTAQVLGGSVLEAASQSSTATQALGTQTLAPPKQATVTAVRRLWDAVNEYLA